MGHLDGVLEDVLAVAVAEFEAAKEGADFGGDALEAELHKLLAAEQDGKEQVAPSEIP